MTQEITRNSSTAPVRIAFDKKSAKPDTLVIFAAGDKLLPAAAALDKKSKGALKRAIKAAKFTGAKDAALVLSGLAGTSAAHIVLAGLGVLKDLTPCAFEKTGSGLLSALNSKRAVRAEILFPSEDLAKAGVDDVAAAVCLAEGAYLNSYRFDKYLTKTPADQKPTLKAVQISVKDPASCRKAFAPRQKVAEGVFLTRDVVSEPPNVLYPESFAATIKAELEPLGVKVRILTEKDMAKHNMGAILAVGQGSRRGPRLVTMEYNGGDKKQKPVAIVGKGVTFDTGGISLKPGAGMEDMKWDMAGAGATVGLMKALAARGAAVNVVGVVGLAENMPSGDAYRPGDIVTSMSGQTIEVHNTDAEGRMVLCDALWYTQETFKPTHIVDMATLTGAVLIALGHEYAGLFVNDDEMAAQLVTAGNMTGEALWRMPMHETWEKSLNTPQADMKNISGNRNAGSAVGAHFLQRFVKKGVKWAHLDIAGTAWTQNAKTSTPKGATAFGVRLLERYIADNFETDAA